MEAARKNAPQQFAQMTIFAMQLKAAAVQTAKTRKIPVLKHLSAITLPKPVPAQMEKVSAKMGCAEPNAALALWAQHYALTIPASQIVFQSPVQGQTIYVQMMKVVAVQIAQASRQIVGIMQFVVQT